VWRPHTCPCGSPPAGATDPADVAPSPLSWCAHPTWQHVWRPSQRRHTCTCNPPKHTVRQFLWDLAVLRGSMCGADATGATLACVAPMPRAPHIHLSVAPAPAPSPTLLSSFSSSLLLLPNRRRRTPPLRPPHQINQGIIRSIRPTPSSSIPQGIPLRFPPIHPIVLVDLVDLGMNPRFGRFLGFGYVEIYVGGIYIVVYVFEPKICWNPRYEILHVCVEILCMYVLKCLIFA
jgi:hypothetical protein